MLLTFLLVPNPAAAEMAALSSWLFSHSLPAKKMAQNNVYMIYMHVGYARTLVYVLSDLLCISGALDLWHGHAGLELSIRWEWDQIFLVGSLSRPDREGWELYMLHKMAIEFLLI